MGLVSSNEADYVSIHWYGMIRAPLFEAYTFSFTYDDWLAMTIDNVSFGAGGTKTLTANTFYDFKLRYIEDSITAYI